VHHFRSYTLVTVADDLLSHWEKVISENICIPTYQIFVGGENEPVKCINTTFLNNGDHIGIDDNMEVDDNDSDMEQDTDDNDNDNYNYNDNENDSDDNNNDNDD